MTNQRQLDESATVAQSSQVGYPREGNCSLGVLAQRCEIRGNVSVAASWRFDQRDFEADERVSFTRLEGWEEMQVAVRTRWDELLEEMVASLPRPRLEELKPRIVMLADRLQSDGKQLQKWHDEHWVDNTLNWRV